MDIHQLKTFLVVAKAGSITRAAGQLHLSQPAVSAHIKSLEASLELTLFERTPRGMRLTAHGALLLPRAEDAVAAHANVLSEAARLNGGLAGGLRVGLGANSAPAAAGALIAALAEAHRGVHVSVREGDSTTVVEELLAGRLDAGFFNVAEGTIDPRLHTLEIGHFGLKLVAPSGTGGQGAVDWRALASETWIFPPESSCCGRAVRTLLRRENIDPVRIIEVDRESSTRTLVAAGTGVGVLHAYTAEAASERGEVEILCDVDLSLKTMLGVLRERRDEPLLLAVLKLAPR